MLSIKSNMLAQNASRQLNIVTNKKAKSTEKLSSGYKVNRAADDAAGLSMSEKMRRQIRGLHQGADNIQDGIGYVQTADGALNEAQEILQRINELSVKAANGTNTEEDRYYIDREIQALKAELSRIFSTTTYNERKIWEPSDRKIIDFETKQAVTFRTTPSTIDITNDNCGVIAYGSYRIHADQDNGVYVSWTGYDGNTYETEPISWEELKKNNYSFEMSDFFGEKTADNNLYNAAGEPVFKHQIAFSVQNRATIDDIIACINDRTFSSGQYAYMYGEFEDSNVRNGVRLSGTGTTSTTSYIDLYYRAAYASNRNTGSDGSTSENIHDFDNADDAFLEPNISGGSNLTSRPSATTVEAAKNSNEGWTFSFYMDGVGEVTATSSSVRYGANDRADEDEGHWWRWQGATVNGKYIEKYQKAGIERTVSSHGNGTLGDVMDALTGERGSSSPGLLTESNKGDADSGGYIDIYFNLTSKSPYSYGSGQTSSDVGTFKIRITVSAGDTEDMVLQRINDALNESTILDFYTPNGSSTFGSASFGTASAAPHTIDAPIYGSTCGFFVEAGPEAGEHISIEYDSLSLLSLGLRDTNTRTAAAAERAINEVKKGLQIVSEQRATFGAYQNRLEHAHNINQNSEENTQSAESQIRDTDIAKTMVEYANQNILSQANTSMLAQANQQPSFIMQLLR